MPYSRALKEYFSDQPLSILYLSIDSKERNWAKSSNKLGLDSLTNSYLVMNRDSSEFLNGIGLTSLPRYLLMNKKGQVINADAPAPRSDQIRPLLDSVLSVSAY